MQYRMPSLFCKYACVQCGESCRNWLVEVYPQELKKILEQLKDLAPQEKRQEHGFDCHRDQSGNIDKVYTREIENRCCFLESDNGCFLHRRFGYELKPSICRSYPFYAIQTPKITYINGAMSCTAIRSLLRKQEDVVAVFPSPEVGSEISVIADLREYDEVNLTPSATMDWEEFYLLQQWLFSLKMPAIFKHLDFFWQELQKSQISPERLREIFACQPDSLKTTSPLEHLSLLLRSFRYCLANLHDSRAVEFAIEYLLRRLRIDADNPDYSAALRYQEYYARNILPINTMCDTIFNNYLRTRLFANEFYFSRSIIESLEILCLFTGMAHMLALAAAGNSGNLSEEHLLDAIFVIDKDLSHSSVFQDFSTGGIRPSVAYAPI